ncbi:MAG: VWA domain-containing protein [Pirellulaceae bacterium]
MATTVSNINQKTVASPSNPNRSWKSGVFSLLFHVILLVVAAVWFAGIRTVGKAGGDTERPGEIVLATIEKSTEAIEYQQQSAEESSADAASKAPSSLPSAMEEPKLEMPDLTSEAPGLAIDLEDLDANRMSRDQTQSKRTGLVLSQDDLDAIAREQRALASRQPPGPATTTSLFGSGDISGRRFVFVLDRSASMGGDGLGVLVRAESELVTAVQNLTDEHFFQIVAYNGDATVMDQRSILKASDENKRKIKPFIASLAAYGPTQHEAGLYIARALQPDVIVFMTDGGYPEMDGGQIKTFVRSLNRQATVHCVQFGMSVDPPNRSFMRDLAATAGGSYTYVNVRDWQLKR